MREVCDCRHRYEDHDNPPEGDGPCKHAECLCLYYQPESWHHDTR